MASAVVGAAACAAWAYLLLARGGFWRERPQPRVDPAGETPAVVAIVPARNEAAVIGRAVAGLLAQDYRGRLDVIVVDDSSSDGTAEAAGLDARLRVVAARPPPSGWTGKPWAQCEGLAQAPDARYVWLTDADILHAPDVLGGLVARAEAGGFDLVSLMARLPTRTFAERALIPAYVFFFQMLYPFAWVRDPKRATAAAAGGCMLVRRSALARIGGLASIRDAIIDDCALARAVKPGGPVWLGLADASLSLRGYARARDVWRLIARGAYAQLRFRPALLALTVLAMTVVYLAPPVLAASGEALGFVAWGLMAFAYLPTLIRHGLSPAWAPVLPAVALFYLAATVESARLHGRGRGGAWKGRAQAHPRG